jgi:hypothetical protein
MRQAFISIKQALPCAEGTNYLAQHAQPGDEKCMGERATRVFFFTGVSPRR